MTQQTPETEIVKSYIAAAGFSYPETVRPPIVKTGNIVQDYIAAAGYGLPKKP